MAEMKSTFPPQNVASLLNFSGTKDEVVIVRRGEGPSVRVLIGLLVLGTIALAGLALAIAVAVSEVPSKWAFSDSWIYLLQVAFAAVPLVVALPFALQCYRRGWNDTVVTITRDNISVHWEGKYTHEPYSFPLSDILGLGIQTRFLPGFSSGAFGPGLVVRFARFGKGQTLLRDLDDARRDDRHILKDGSKAELKWVKDLVSQSMEERGWNYRHMTWVQ